MIAASLWQNPHIIVLDEPTNYLDRDSLGALVAAIHDFKGGIIVISHNREFAGAVCQEKWIMEKGCLRREGESVALHADQEEMMNDLGGKTVVDAMGNEIKVQAPKPSTDKEKKQEIKKLEKLMKEARKRKNDDLVLDLELRLDELRG